MPNPIREFHVKAGIETHFPGGHSSVLVCEIIPLFESLNNFQLLQQNRPGFYWQEPPLLPTFWFLPSGSVSRNTLWRFTVEKRICDKRLNQTLQETWETLGRKEQVSEVSIPMVLKILAILLNTTFPGSEIKVISLWCCQYCWQNSTYSGCSFGSADPIITDIHWSALRGGGIFLVLFVI